MDIGDVVEKVLHAYAVKKECEKECRGICVILPYHYNFTNSGRQEFG